MYLPKTYSDEIYYDSITTLVGDIYYANNSYRSKIADMRVLAEHIIRRLIKYSPKDKLELGDYRTRTALKKAGVTEGFFWHAFDILHGMGNDSSHSKKTVMPTKEDFDRATNAILHLYAYMFFDYFKKYPFGSSEKVMSAFSLLPPFLRLTVLGELLDLDKSNMDVVKKIRLVMVKTLGLEGAMEMVEHHKEEWATISVPYSSTDLKEKLERYNWDYVKAMSEMQESLYDYFVRELPCIKILGDYPLYTTYEEAKKYYLEHGILEGTSPEITEFNSLMKYIYTGRKINEDTLHDPIFN